MSSITKEAFMEYTDTQTFNAIKEFDTISQMWQQCVEKYSKNIAIDDGSNQYTYAQLDADAAVFRGVLASQGEANARIGIISANNYNLVKAILAVTTSGKCAVILPAHLDEKTIYGCCMKFNIRTLIYQPEFEEKVGFAGKTVPGLKLISSDAANSDAAPITIPNCKDGCLVMLTSGTTGQSKGALLSNKAVMQGVVNGCYGYKDVFEQRYMLVLPLSHVFGLIRTLLTCLYTGSTLFICANNKNMFRDIAVFRPTVLIAVPALAEMALNLSKQFKKNMLGEDMKYIICGAAPVAPYLINEYNKIGIALLPGYGLTESANLVSGNPEAIAKPESVGLPYPNQKLRIENGELWIKGDNMMDGYVGDEEANKSAYEDGWFKTGDLVRFDKDGFMYITGRIKELIILSNGENVSPAEVEAHYNNLDFVQDSQIFEDMDENGHHYLSLEIVPRMSVIAPQNLENPGKYMMEALEKVNRSLPGYMQVSKIVIRDKDFDRSPSMKIVRYKKCN